MNEVFAKMIINYKIRWCQSLCWEVTLSSILPLVWGSGGSLLTTETSESVFSLTVLFVLVMVSMYWKWETWGIKKVNCCQCVSELSDLTLFLLLHQQSSFSASENVKKSPSLHEDIWSMAASKRKIGWNQCPLLSQVHSYSWWSNSTPVKWLRCQFSITASAGGCSQ